MILLTWNMQGARGSASVGPSSKRKRVQFDTNNISDAVGLLGKVTVLCLQEAGGAPPGWGLTAHTVGGVQIDYGIVNFGSSSRPHQAAVVWYDSKVNTTATHNRCSLAVLSTSYSGQYGVVEHSSAGLRPLLGLEMANGDWVYSIHAPSGNHNAAAGVADSLLSAIPANEDYICAGDFNCSPLDMQNKGYAPESGSGPTHQGGSTLDFAIGRGVTITAQDSNQLELSQMVSDHYSQFFDVT